MMVGEHPAADVSEIGEVANPLAVGARLPNAVATTREGR